MTEVPTKSTGSVLSQVRGTSNWYALSTRSRHEKRVAQRLTQRGIECYLPLYSSLRRWRDRSVRIELPLFPGYLFLRIPLAERSRIFQLPGVIRLVAFAGQPVAVEDNEITRIRTIVAHSKVEPHPYLSVGRRVWIKSGALQGMQGILTRKKNLLRVIVTLDAIARSYAVEVNALDLEPFGVVEDQIPHNLCLTTNRY